MSVIVDECFRRVKSSNQPRSRCLREIAELASHGAYRKARPGVHGAARPQLAAALPVHRSFAK